MNSTLTKLTENGQRLLDHLEQRFPQAAGYYLSKIVQNTNGEADITKPLLVCLIAKPIVGDPLDKKLVKEITEEAKRYAIEELDQPLEELFTVLRFSTPNRPDNRQSSQRER